MSNGTTEKREATSIKILPSVWKNAKKAAIDDNVDLSIYFENALRYFNSLTHPEREKLS